MATQQQLAEAQQALHKVIVGKGVVSIQKDGRKVEYSPANQEKLQAYVKQLESELAGPTRRAFGVRA